MTLNDLHTGETATIARIHGHGAFRKRLTEMGFIRGKPVTVLKAAPLLDPVEFRILDSNVSLRRSEASLVEVITGPGIGTISSVPGSDVSDILSRWAGRMNHEKTIEVALVGNPNCGKTTLFNRLSHSKEHVGNYPGVTVGSKEALFRYRGYTFRITDLPGTYSLSDYSPEERFVREHILHHQPDVVVNVVDANHLERNLYLTSQLLDMEKPIVLALNMYDDLLARKDSLDMGLLSKLLGVRVVPTISHRGKGIYRLFNHVIRVFEEKDPAIRHIQVNYGEELEQSIQRLERLINTNQELATRYAPRFLALKLLEQDDAGTHLLADAGNFTEIISTAGEEVERLRSLYKEDPESMLTDARYGFIAGALKETLKQSGRDPVYTRSQRIDRLLTHKYFGLPVFMGFLWLMFHATFTLGQYPMQWIGGGVDLLGKFLSTHMADGIFSDMLIDGVIGGVGGVIVFLPNILILFFFISLMEDTGYMARTAFIMDRMMHLFGLHGKSFIPLIMGFGCNVPAIMATRTLENRNDRLLTMLIIPFMSCSARLPVYVLIAGAIFPERAGHVIFMLYMIGVVFSLLMSMLFKKILFKNREAPFVMELPIYRNPGIRVILLHMWRKGAHYLKKMGGVILVASVVIWALGYFPRNVEYSRDYDRLLALESQHLAAMTAAKEGEDGKTVAAIEERMATLNQQREAERQQQSYIGRLGKAVEPAIRPLGFDWKMGISLITGFAAKEIVVSTMGVLYQADDPTRGRETVSLQTKIREQVYLSGPKKGTPVFTPLAGISFLLFVLFYLPCMAVIAAVGKESGSWKWAGFVLVYTTGIAWMASFLVYQVGTLFHMG